MNTCQLVGRLTRDPDLRYTGSGLAVVQFTVAVERTYTNAQGEHETDFINVVAWRKTAEVVSNFTRKGSLVGVTGRIQTRNYTNNEGRKIYITEILCENFQMLEPKAVTEARSKQNQENNHQGQSNNNQPAASASNQTSASGNYHNFDEDPFENNGDSIDISDDDLPF